MYSFFRVHAHVYINLFEKKYCIVEYIGTNKNCHIFFSLNSRHGSVHHKRSLSTKKKTGGGGGGAKTGQAHVNHGFSKDTTVIHDESVVTTGDTITKQNLAAETNIHHETNVGQTESNAIHSEPKDIANEPKMMPNETKDVPTGPTVTAKEGDVYMATNGNIVLNEEDGGHLATDGDLAAGVMVAAAGELPYSPY